MNKSYINKIVNLEQDYFSKLIEEFTFSITSFGQWQSHGSYTITNNMFPYHRLIYIVEGEMEYISEGKSYTLHQHDIVYTPANTLYSAYGDASTNPSFYYIYFHIQPVHLIDKFVQLMTYSNQPSIYHAKNSKVEYLTLSMFEEYSHQLSGYHYKLHCLLLMILIELLRIRQAYQLPSTFKNITSTSSNEIINQATALINSKLNAPLKVGQLARILGVSENYLYKLFKQTLGISPQEYLLNCKLTQAKQMLLNTNKTITQIASELAFSSSNHFSNLFYQKEGIRPKEYRSQVQK